MCNREAIYRCIDASKVIKPVKRKQQKYFKNFLAGKHNPSSAPQLSSPHTLFFLQCNSLLSSCPPCLPPGALLVGAWTVASDAPYIKTMLLRLNLSTDGIATSGIDSSDIISNDPIGKISFASGGDGAAYSFLTYVAKDRRDNRYCHVFDCGKVADDLLATLGQVFNILQNKQNTRRQPKPPPLPANHPTAENRHLAGVAALQAAPKVEPKQQEESKADGDEDATCKRYCQLHRLWQPKKKKGGGSNRESDSDTYTHLLYLHAQP